MTIRGVPAMVCVVLALSACDGGRSSSHRGPLATYRLSGAVSERTPDGQAPVEGVRIEETQTHQHTTTDVGGFYSLSGLYATRSTFLAGKPGYVSEAKALVISGDTRLDLQLRRVEIGASSFRPAFPLPGQEAKQP